MRRAARNRLAKSFSDPARTVAVIGSKFVVPRKLDDDGKPLTKKTFNPVDHLRTLTLKEMQFLAEWRSAKWNFEGACKLCNLSPAQGLRIKAKVEVFHQEEEKIRALAQIPTPEYIAAKDLENVEGRRVIGDSEHKSLDRLAKIVGAFKPTSAVNIQQNVFQMPAMPAEVAAKMKEIADKAADAIDAEVA